MKAAVSLAIFFAALVRAANGVTGTDQLPVDAQVNGAADPVAPEIKKLAEELKRFNGCFMQHLWQDVRNHKVGCGREEKKKPYLSSENYRNHDLVSCICNNKKGLSNLVRRNFRICVHKARSSREIIHDIGAGKQHLPISQHPLPPKIFTTCMTFSGD